MFNEIRKIWGKKKESIFSDKNLLRMINSGIGVHWLLLEMAESVNAPETQPSDGPNWCTEVEFEGKHGWKVSIFYDCGDIDYIDHFVAPDGHIINFWNWPGDGVNPADPDFNDAKNVLVNWRGNGCLKRMRDLENGHDKRTV